MEKKGEGEEWNTEEVDLSYQSSPQLPKSKARWNVISWDSMVYDKKKKIIKYREIKYKTK